MKDKKYATYDVARKLKNLGFDKETVFYWKISTNAQDTRRSVIFCGPDKYDNYNQKDSFTLSAPSRDEIIEWFRNKFGYYIYIIPRFDGFDGSQFGCHYSIFKEGDKEDSDAFGDGSYTFEEAEDSAIKEVLDFLEKK